MQATQAKTDFDVITVGDVFTDLVLTGFTAWPRPGEEAFATALRSEAGGGAAITACGLARLGLRTALLAAVGDDGAWLVERVGDGGVHDKLIRRVGGEMTGLTVSVSTAADRTFFTYQGANRALPRLLAVDFDARLALARARHVHIASALKPDLLREIAQALRQAGTTVSLDVGWQFLWLKDERSRQALREVDLFFPNEREAALLTGQQQPEEILRACAAMGLPRVALKRGAHGAMLLWQGAILHGAPHPVTPVDTTGAGDCFDAGFIYGWLCGDAPQRCLQIANLCGALSTEGVGGIAASHHSRKSSLQCRARK